MSEFMTVAKAGSIPRGTGVSFTIHGKIIAVFNIDGDYFAINDLCPHMGASLAEGHVEQGVVTCPWHAWRFQVRDGTWCDDPRIKTDCYEVRVSDGEIQVRMSSGGDSCSNGERAEE